MTPNNELAPGFITIDQAVELIKSDSRDNPTIDMDYISSHTVWIEVNQNFRIPKVRKLKPEEVRRTKYGKIKDEEHIGDVYVAITTNYERELLKKTIFDKFREMTGKEYKELGVRARSTVADDAQGKAAVQPRVNAKPIAKEGAIIGEGTTMDTNGQNITV